MFASILDRRLNAVFICSALLATLSVVPTGPGHAELFWPHYRSWGWDDYGPFRSHHYRSSGWGDSEPYRQRRQRANKNYAPDQKASPREIAKGPLQIIVSIVDQRISVYDDGTLIARSSVSTGVQGHPTPVGVFSVIGKELWHRSNIYSAAPMPYMQRITWSGDRTPCRCLARPSSLSRLHSLGQGFRRSTVASHEAGHPRNHCAQRSRSSSNS